MSTHTQVQQIAATASNIIAFVPKSGNRGQLEQKTAYRTATAVHSRNIILANHLVDAACEAQAEGDVQLAEHLLEAAYEAFDRVPFDRIR